MVISYPVIFSGDLRNCLNLELSLINLIKMILAPGTEGLLFQSIKPEENYGKKISKISSITSNQRSRQ